MANPELTKVANKVGGRSKGKTVCIFLGEERLAKLKARARQLGYVSFSEYISAIGDSALDLTPDDLKQLRALAILKKVDLSALVAQLVKRLVS